MIITNQPAQQPVQNEDKPKKSESKTTQTATTKEGVLSRATAKFAQPITEIEQKLGQLANKLLNELKASSEKASTKALTQAQGTQIAPNLASDVKDLVSALLKEPKLLKFAGELEKFAKPVETMKAENIGQNIKDSGVMLEAKIADILSGQELPAKIKELISMMKNVSTPSLKQGFLQLPNDDDAAKSFSDLNKLLASEQSKNAKELANSGLKTIVTAGDKIENAVKFLDKLANQLSAKPELAAEPKTTAKALLTLDAVQKNLNEVLRAANSLNLDNPALKEAKLVRNQMNALANALSARIADVRAQVAGQANSNLNSGAANSNLNASNPVASNPATQASQASAPQANSNLNAASQSAPHPAEQGTAQAARSESLNPNSNLNSAATQNAMGSGARTQININLQGSNLNAFLGAIDTGANTQNLQSSLSLIAQKLTHVANAVGGDAVAAKNALSEIKALTTAAKAAQSEISNITARDEASAAKTLQNDLKSVLLGLKDATEGAQSPSQNSINQTANRLLSQIEINQLISYAQNSVQTHLPYTWDELEGSSIAFKRGQKNKFYARIELNFVRYGNISVVLGLADSKYLDVSIVAGEEEFKNRILDESRDLKQALTAQGLIINSFFLAQKSSQITPYGNTAEAMDVGYNVKA